MKIKLNELCNDCRLNAIVDGYRCGCAWRDIDNEYCPFYEFLKFKISECEEQEILITSHNVYYVRKYIILKRVNRMYQSNCYQF